MAKGKKSDPSMQGGVVQGNMPAMTRCPTCDGRGFNNGQMCPTCKGTGQK